MKDLTIKKQREKTDKFRQLISLLDLQKQLRGYDYDLLNLKYLQPLRDEIEAKLLERGIKPRKI